MFKDDQCSQAMTSSGNECETKLSEVRDMSTNDTVYYKTKDACHPCKLSGNGFHLGHEDTFYQCTSQDSTIAACILGDMTANMSCAHKKHGEGALALYRMLSTPTKP